jgi:AraC-like DNA-binding protein
MTFAGIAISRKNTNYWDVSKYNCLKLRLKTTGNDHLGVIINTFLDGYSQPGNYATYLHSEVEIQNNGEFTDYTLPFKFFSVPKWWYTLNNLTFTGNQKGNLKKTGTVELASCAFCDVAVKHQIQVQSIKLANRYGILYFLALAAGIAGYGLIVFLYFSKKLPVLKTSRADLHYTKLALSNRGDEGYGKVAAFLADAFHESDLTIDKVAKATGVSIYKIPVLIKNQTNRSFKEYLNTIRLTEAQRLLSETDRQIIEISMAVGYNNISHFNRIFKEKNGKTPREFREQSINSRNDS